MNGSRTKAIRKQANAGAMSALGTVAPAIREVNARANAAFFNESLTRDRVEALEKRVEMAETLVRALLGFKGRPFFERLRWLLLGR